VRSLSIAAFALGVAFALGSGACGGKATDKPVAGATVEKRAPANPIAVSRMAQGVQAMKDKVPAKAIEFFREAIKQDSGLWEARFDLGVVLAQTGDLAGAEEELARAAKMVPAEEDVAVALAEVRRRRGEAKDAADGLEDFVKANPNSVASRAIYVTALRESGQFDAAIAQAQNMLQKKPGDAVALAELALCYLAKGNHDTAELVAKQAIDANPKSAQAHRANGLVALAEGDDALAFQAFSKASAEDPRDTTSRLNMASVLMRAGVYPKAEEQYRAILQVAPDDADAMVGLAAALRGQADPKATGKLEEARALYEKVLVNDPHALAAELNLGVLYMDYLKKPGDAKTMFTRFLDDAPRSHPARAQAEKYLSAVSAASPSAPAAPAPAAPAAAPAPASAPAPAAAPGGGAKPMTPDKESVR
jgi:tetratricopeptide (TPR) repeat protein